MSINIILRKVNKMAMKKTAKPKPVPSGSRKIIGAAISRTVTKKTLKPGSMATQSKMVAEKNSSVKKLKRPTGELSKSNSSLAKFIKDHGMAKGFTAAEARTAAGKYRDAKKAAGPKGFGGLDASGNALGLAIQKTRKMRKGK
jgi:hypothetical protein